MTARLNSSEAGFDAALATFLASRRTGVSARVDGPVREIIQDVQARGADAVLDATAKFDRFQALDADALRVDPSLMQAALNGLSKPLRSALETAASRIRAFHEKQIPEGFEYTDEIGVQLGMRWSAIDAVGLYVPGGAAAYPSSVLMNAIPAKVAGVQRLAMVAPTPGGEDNAMVLAAAALAGAAGGLMAMAIGQVDPDSMVYWTVSGELVFITIMAGSGSVLAPFIGAIIFEFLRTYAFEFAPHAWQLIVGSALLLIIFLLPGGIWSLLERVPFIKGLRHD